MANFKTETELFMETLIKDGLLPKDVKIEGIYIANAYDTAYLQETGDTIDWKAMQKALHRDGKNPWEYDDDFGSEEFVGWITFKDSNIWMQREEYDGREWWATRKKPSIEEQKAILERRKKRG